MHSVVLIKGTSLQSITHHLAYRERISGGIKGVVAWAAWRDGWRDGWRRGGEEERRGGILGEAQTAVGSVPEPSANPGQNRRPSGRWLFPAPVSDRLVLSGEGGVGWGGEKRKGSPQKRDYCSRRAEARKKKERKRESKKKRGSRLGPWGVTAPLAATVHSAGWMVDWWRGVAGSLTIDWWKMGRGS